jgi:hypothetical protein
MMFGFVTFNGKMKTENNIELESPVKTNTKDLQEAEQQANSLNND